MIWKIEYIFPLFKSPLCILIMFYIFLHVNIKHFKSLFLVVVSHPILNGTVYSIIFYNRKASDFFIQPTEFLMKDLHLPLLSKWNTIILFSVNDTSPFHFLYLILFALAY